MSKTLKWQLRLVVLMATVDRLGHVAIRVGDVARAVEFYTGLGMRLVWKARRCYLEAGPDGMAWPLGPTTRLPAPTCLSFPRSCRGDVHDQLKQAGVFGSVHDHRDGTASFYFKDPDGNWLRCCMNPCIPSNCG